MINLLNLATSSLGFLANILIVRSVVDLGALDSFYTLIQIALTISGFFSAAIMYNLVPKLIASVTYQEQVENFAQLFYRVTIAIVLATLIFSGFGFDQTIVVALVLILLGLAIDGAIWQSKKMLRLAVGFQMLPQMFVVITIVVMQLPVIIEYTIALMIAYVISRFIMAQELRKNYNSCSTKINLDFLILLRNSILAGIGSFVFGVHPFLDVYFSAHMSEGSLTLLVIAQRILIASANLFIYSRFLKATHEFEQSKRSKDTVSLVYRNMIFNTGAFLFIVLIVWFGFTPILLLFKITNQADRLWATIVEMLPGIFFMMQAVLLLRYIKSVDHRLRFDSAMIGTWVASYVSSFYMFDGYYHTVAFCYSVAWGVTTLGVMLPTALAKLNRR